MWRCSLHLESVGANEIVLALVPLYLLDSGCVPAILGLYDTDIDISMKKLLETARRSTIALSSSYII